MIPKFTPRVWSVSVSVCLSVCRLGNTITPSMKALPGTGEASRDEEESRTFSFGFYLPVKVVCLLFDSRSENLNSWNFLNHTSSPSQFGPPPPPLSPLPCKRESRSPVGPCFLKPSQSVLTRIEGSSSSSSTSAVGGRVHRRLLSPSALKEN